MYKRQCGGLALTPAAVDAFVAAVLALLRPNGVAVFDQEGGWPFGLETMMRDAVRRRDAHLLVRRGPIGTNVDYIISRQALTDDVSSDPLQRVSRVADAFLVATPLLVASLQAPPDAEYAGALLATKRCSFDDKDIPVIRDLYTKTFQNATRVAKERRPRRPSGSPRSAPRRHAAVDNR